MPSSGSRTMQKENRVKGTSNQMGQPLYLGQAQEFNRKKYSQHSFILLQQMISIQIKNTKGPTTEMMLMDAEDNLNGKPFPFI